MSFRKLEYMLALYEHRNMTKAAKSLYVSQPTLSRFLANYEEELGAPLFERKNDALVPTYFCEKIIIPIKKILIQKKDFDREVAELTGKDRIDDLSIGCTPALSIAIMPGTVSALRKVYPASNISLHEGPIEELKSLMLEGKIDIIFTHSQLNCPEISMEKIFDEAILLVTSAQNPLNKKAEKLPSCTEYLWIDIKHLKDVPFITKKQMNNYKLLAQDLSENDIEPQILFYSRYTSTTYQLLPSYKDAVTISDKTQWLAVPESIRTGLTALYIKNDNHLYSRPLYALTRSEGYQSKLLRYSIRIVRDLFSKPS